MKQILLLFLLVCYRGSRGLQATEQQAQTRGALAPGFLLESQTVPAPEGAFIDAQIHGSEDPCSLRTLLPTSNRSPKSHSPLDWI